MQPYQPEETFVRPPGAEELEAAAENMGVCQAMCIKCDEHHDLHLDLGDQIGTISRQEAALGLAEGSVRDIALLSRVGKAVSFQVMGRDDRGQYLLSRRAAQAEVRAYFFSALTPGDILQVRVLSAGKFGAFCDVGCGLTALMPLSRCCVSRLRGADDLWKPGMRICAALWQLDDNSGRILLSGRETLGNWDENTEAFRQGQTVTGIARTVMPYGIFVELTPNLSGLAEPAPGIQAGDPVSVFIRAMNRQRHKIKLNILEKLDHSIAKQPEFFVTSGHLNKWEFFPGSGAVTYF